MEKNKNSIAKVMRRQRSPPRSIAETVTRSISVYHQ